MLKTTRSLLQLVRIARVLARHDALFLLERIRAAAPAVRIARVLSKRNVRRLRPGERLARALSELGPTFIKLGQALSTRADLVGADVAEDLCELRADLPPFETATLRAIVEKDLGRPITALFAEFDDEPHAAASIAQVHFATTSDGHEVAVKVLRPNVEAAFKRDLELFYWLAKTTKRLQPSLKRFKPVEMVETFEHMVMLEMDMRFEGAAAAELADNFYGDDTFHVPEVDWIRTGARVLTMERINGVPIDDRKAIVAAGLDPKEITRNAANVFFQMVFRDGFFHGDMHPGNLFVDSKGVITVVDFGIMGRVDKQTQRYLAEMLYGFVKGDFMQVARAHFAAGYVSPTHSLEEFAQACRSISEPIFGLPMNEISIGRLLSQLFQVIETFGMETQPQLLLLQKTMLTAEGIGRSLTPSINMWELSRPMVEQLLAYHLGPQEKLRAKATDIASSLEHIPSFLENASLAAKQVSTGTFRIDAENLREILDINDRYTHCRRRRIGFIQILPWILVVVLLAKFFRM